MQQKQFQDYLCCLYFLNQVSPFEKYIHEVILEKTWAFLSFLLFHSKTFMAVVTYSHLSK